MNTVGKCAAAIRRAGGTARLVRDGEYIPFPASVQPRLRGDAPDMSPLGLEAGSTAILYGGIRDGVALKPGDVVEYGGSRYRVLRREAHLVEERPVYWWALVRRETSLDGGDLHG